MIYEYYLGFKRVRDQVRHRKSLRYCHRCALLTDKRSNSCSHCSHLNDAALQVALASYDETRLKHGFKMLEFTIIAALLLALVLLLFSN
jgi:hypothetical protein